MIEAPSGPPPSGRPRRPLRALNSHSIIHADDEKMQKRVPVGVRRAQEWMHIRFAGTQARDFCDDGILCYTAQTLEAPKGFENRWAIIGEQHWAGGTPSVVEYRTICMATVILLFADPMDREQMKRVRHAAAFINVNFEESPHLVFVPHTVRPDLRKQTNEDGMFSSIASTLAEGIDMTIVGEPEGLKFAWEIQNKLRVQSGIVGKFHHKEAEKEQQLRHVEHLEQNVHDIVWDYLRARLKINLPPVDWSIGRGIPHTIQHLRVGELLGKGACGRVHKLEFDGIAGGHTGAVMKVVPKRRISSLRCLLEIDSHLRVMRALSSLWPHPNICKLQHAFQSETHLLFQLEDCGSQDLYKYFRSREDKEVPMSPANVQSIISQLVSAVCHMHLKPNVVHRDIKPENIILFETATSIRIQIIDFDTARIEPEVPSFGVVGTFPFSAPEMVLQGEYDPYAADMWSMGIVILEVLCCMKIVETSLGLQLDEQSVRGKAVGQVKKRDGRNALTSRIANYFAREDAVVCLLQASLRPELANLVNHSWYELLEGVLQINPLQRWRAKRACKQSL